MSKKTVAAVVVGGVLAATATVVARMNAGTSAEKYDSRWRVVTVGISPGLEPAGMVLPRPLEELRDRIEVRVGAAPGRRGVELAARPLVAADDSEDEELVGRIRSALRESKQLLEVGYVIANEPQPEGHRPKTPAGILVDALVRRSSEGGIL